MVTDSSAQTKDENKSKQSHKNHWNGIKIRIEKKQCKLLKNIHSGNINRRFCYISYYNDKFCVLMSLRTVAMIWLPTTICGMGACSWTASFASWLNSSLQNRTFCAASNFCCQCTSGLVLVGPEPRRFIVALHRSSWSEHIIHTYHYLSCIFVCFVGWLVGYFTMLY